MTQTEDGNQAFDIIPVTLNNISFESTKAKKYCDGRRRKGCEYTFEAANHLQNQ